MTTAAHQGTSQRPVALLLGASGFIGRRLAVALVAAGYEVRSASRRGTPSVDYAKMITASQWLPHLAGVSLVVNAVGMLRDTPNASLLAIHEQAPIALFDACAQAGLTRVLQISALGVDGNETGYARTKRNADRHLLLHMERCTLQPLIARPSLVFGTGGASTQLFMRLARMPALMMPGPMLHYGVQPVAVAELAEALVAMLQAGESGLVEIGGPQALTMADLVATLRRQMGKRPALVVRLPDWITRASARMGDQVSSSPWCSASLELASHDNTCSPDALRQWLGRTPTAPGQLLASMAR